MKKVLISFLVLSGFFKVNAQGFTGYFADNYAGVIGVMHNPASIADSRFRTDVNIFSTSASLANDYYGLNMLNPSTKAGEADIEPKENNFLFAFADVMGPSAMFNITPKYAGAISTRGRALANGHDVNGKLIDALVNGKEDYKEKADINVGSPKILGNVWSEYGVTFATTILNKDKHFVKGGLTAKYLYGFGMVGINGENVSLKYTKPADINDVWKLKAGEDIKLTGVITTEGVDAQNLKEIKEVINHPGSGIGFDLGFVYEFRPKYESFSPSKATPADRGFRSKNKYLVRFGVSVTDIGSINYKGIKTYTYDVNEVGQAIESAMADMKIVNEFLTKNTVDNQIDVAKLKDMAKNINDLNKIEGLSGLTTLKDISKVISQDDLNKIVADAQNGTVDLAEISKKVNPAGIVDLNSMIDDLKNPDIKTKDISVSLPTMLHLDADYNFYKNFFVSANANIDMSSRDAHSSYLLNTYVLSPRYETRHFTFALPLNYIEVVGAQVGFVLRAGPFFMGSSSAVTNLTSKTKAADVFFGFKVPLYQKADKDTDGDGILDSEDKCKKEVGSAENKGCPTKEEKQLKKDNNTKVVKESKKGNSTAPKPTEKDAEKQKKEQEDTKNTK